MLAFRFTPAFLRSKLALSAFALLTTSIFAFSQDSYMVGFSPAGFGAMVINRGRGTDPAVQIYVR
jgi:hypothetical protein